MTSPSEPPDSLPGAGATRWDDLVSRGMLAGIALLALVFLLEPILDLGSRVPRNYNEGWNAYLAQRAVGDGSLYPGPEERLVNNYPPLSFAVIGGLAGDGDPVVTGRLVSALSLLVTLIGAAVITRRMGGSTKAAVFATSAYGFAVAVLAPDYVAMNDPQFLGHATIVLAWLCLPLGLGDAEGEEGTPARTVAALAAAGVLTICALALKNNLVAFPLAVTAWLALRHRRALFAWLAVTVPLGLLFLAGCFWIWGDHFFDNVLDSSRDLNPRRLADKLFRWVPPTTPLLLGALLWLHADRRSTGGVLLVLYMTFAGAWSLIVLSGAGISYNLLFELLFGACIAGGLLLDRLEASVDAGVDRDSSPFRTIPWGTVLPVALLVGLLALVPQRLVELRDRVVHGERREAEAEEVIARLRAASRPVLCETLALCFWAGADDPIDTFNMGQRMRQDPERLRELVSRIERQEFEWIQLERPTGTTRLPEAFDTALHAHYRLAESTIAAGSLFRARRTP